MMNAVYLNKYSSTRYMKLHYRLILTMVLLAAGLCAAAQKQESKLIYTDAATLPLYGKVVPDDGPRFRRLPPEMQAMIREPLWNLGCHSAGLYIRFRSDAPRIHAKWTNTGFRMPHMTDCGVGGLDLYALIDGQWRFVGSGFKSGDQPNERNDKLVVDMEPVMREYMLYLSLYDEVKTLELGIPEGYVIEPSEEGGPSDAHPVIMYGSSILQGGCASRPGMAFTNILSRRLDRTVVNLGFSGSAVLDYEIAELMARSPSPSAYVLDYVPNASPDNIRERGERFFSILRQAHPEVPVIFVEDPPYPHSIVNKSMEKEIRLKNEAQKALYETLRKAGHKRIYYIPSEGMLGDDGEATVDGVHFTDFGMRLYVDHVLPTLRRALKKQPK